MIGNFLITWLFFCLNTIVQPYGVGTGTIVVEGQNITIFGSILDSACTTMSANKWMGEPNRIERHYDVYDSLGISILNYYESDSIPRLAQIMAVYQESTDPDHQRYSFRPTGYYRGSVVIDGFTITKETKFSELNKALPYFHFEKYLADYYRGFNDRIVASILFDEQDESVIWVAVHRYRGKKNW